MTRITETESRAIQEEERLDRCDVCGTWTTETEMVEVPRADGTMMRLCAVCDAKEDHDEDAM